MILIFVNNILSSQIHVMSPTGQNLLYTDLDGGIHFWGHGRFVKIWSKWTHFTRLYPVLLYDYSTKRTWRHYNRNNKPSCRPSYPIFMELQTTWSVRHCKNWRIYWYCQRFNLLTSLISLMNLQRHWLVEIKWNFHMMQQVLLTYTYILWAKLRHIVRLA